jgi:four helix bundle protein
MDFVANFKDLEVYKVSRTLSKDVFVISHTFPKGEMYSLTNQIRRSSRSVGAQIAEAWARRKYEKHFVSKLTDSFGELLETQHWIETGLDCGYISLEDAEGLVSTCNIVGRMLNAMITKAPAFCEKFRR